MKNLKSLTGSVVVLFVLFAGCSDQLLSPQQSMPSGDKALNNEQVSSQTYTIQVKLAPYEAIKFNSDNLPFKIFNHFKIKNFVSSEDRALLNEIFYQCHYQGFNENVYEYLRPGDEIARSIKGMEQLRIKNYSESVIKLELTFWE